jgi:hypothetical protein
MSSWVDAAAVTCAGPTRTSSQKLAELSSVAGKSAVGSALAVSNDPWYELVNGAGLVPANEIGAEYTLRGPLTMPPRYGAPVPPSLPNCVWVSLKLLTSPTTALYGVFCVKANGVASGTYVHCPTTAAAVLALVSLPWYVPVVAAVICHSANAALADCAESERQM